jgi:(p)ppGpp synthase/HD superfamily hydrolase
MRRRRTSSVTLTDAIVAAVNLHAGQRDESGAPYILHQLRVMLAMRTDEERIAAVLHDTVEDHGWDALRVELGGEVPLWLEEALDALTRCDGEDHCDFIARAGANAIARAVTIAELQEHGVRLDRKPRTVAL